VTAEQIRDWLLGGLGGGGLAVAGKAVWQLMNRRQAVRQMNAEATKTEIESLALPFQQATELMKMLREDLDNARKRAAELERLLLIYRKLLIDKGVVPPET